MKMKHWLLALALGLSCQPLLAQGDRETGKRKDGRMEQMRQDLNLSDAQVAQIQAIHEQYRPERKALRDAEPKDPAIEAQRKQIREAEQAAVKAVLTPEQQKRYDELRAERHAGHHGHHDHMDSAQRQYFQDQVLPLLQSQRLKLEAAISAADKATVDRLRSELQVLRASRKAAQPREKTQRHTPPTDADRALMAEFHAKRHAIMEEAAAIANRYAAQIQQLHEEIKPQLEQIRAELEAQRPAKTTDAADDHHRHPGHRGHMRDGKKHMEAARFLLMDPARTPGQGRTKADRTEGVRLEVFPNPAVSRATLRYGVAAAGMTKVELVDGEGRVLRVLSEGQTEAGEHFLDLDTVELPAGTYYFRVTDSRGSKVRTLKVIH
jgi:protein CpxP